MEELLPNPDGCTKFEPNQFKKEKCKHCGYLWTHHKDAISDDIVQGFQKVKQKAAEDKEKKEADARAAAQAKKQAKKKQNQAAEDEWLFDGAEDAASKTTADEDSDDDFGFRMFSPAELASAAPSSNPPESRQLKIRNLIDWGECDVPEEPEERPPVADVIEASHGPAVSSTHHVPVSQISSGHDVGLRESCPSISLPGPVGGPSAGDADLLEEMQLLQERLAYAEEEKQIQVEIVRDEVKEKQQKVDELTNQTAELQAQLKEARARIEELSDELDESRSSLKREEAESQQYRSEAERLRASVLEVEAKLEAKTAEAGQQSAVPVADSAEAQSQQQVSESHAGDNSALEAEAPSSDAKSQLRASETSAALPASGDGSFPTPDAEQTVEKMRLRCEEQVAQAVRDIRVSVEQQLAWILHAQSRRLQQQASAAEKLADVAARPLPEETAARPSPEADDDELLKLDVDVTAAPSLPKADDDDDQLLL